MALSVDRFLGNQMATNRAKIADPTNTIYCIARSMQHIRLMRRIPRADFRRQVVGQAVVSNVSLYSKGCWRTCGNPSSYAVFKDSAFSCQSTGSETKECTRISEDGNGTSRGHAEENEVEEIYGSVLTDDPGASKGTFTGRGLCEACKFVYNDAKYVHERVRSDMILLSRGITRLNNRARQDAAILGLGFLRLDARAREDTEKIDHGVKKRAERLHHIATVLKDKAGSKLKRVADKHWSDGALEADLRRADLLVKRRAMEDAYMALEFVKNIHDMMVRKMCQLSEKQDFSSVNDVVGCVTLEKNGKALDSFLGEVSTDRITALQKIYWDMASALSEADGIDYTDPEELELLVTTLIDLDAMDGKSSVSLLAECSSSPDVSTRQALANALAAAPSMWTLGNAGMGALQRLAEDSHPAVAAAASKAIAELRRQWEIEEGDSWRFTMNKPTDDDREAGDKDDLLPD